MPRATPQAAPLAAQRPGPLEQSQATAAVAPLPPIPVTATGLEALLRLEGEARDALSVADLRHLVANETWKFVRAGQVFIFELDGGEARITTVSSLSSFDRNAPLIRTLEGAVDRLGKPAGLDRMSEFHLDGLVDALAGDTIDYPLKEMVWVPFVDRRGNLFGGMLIARDVAWQANDIKIAERLARTYAHAWAALKAEPHWLADLSLQRHRAAVGIGLAMLLALAVVPVPMSALVPAEIVARDPEVVAAPIDGVIGAVHVSPNSAVERNAQLVSFVATDLRNRLNIAENEVLVAEARVKRSQQNALRDPDARRELAIASAELEVRTAERDYARDLVAKSVVRAGRSGIALFGDSRELIGRPVRVGERLLEIAQRELVQVRIDAPVGDALLLTDKAPVTVYLDSDPFRPFEAKIERADYRAREVEGRRLSIRAMAVLTETGIPPPRLGVRGTARVYGSTVPLGVYLFRRPIAAARQWLGI